MSANSQVQNQEPTQETNQEPKHEHEKQEQWEEKGAEKEGVKAEENGDKTEKPKEQKKEEKKENKEEEKKGSWKDSIYNPRTGEFLGRTASSWGKSGRQSADTYWDGLSLIRPDLGRFGPTLSRGKLWSIYGITVSLRSNPGTTVSFWSIHGTIRLY